MFPKPCSSCEYDDGNDLGTGSGDDDVDEMKRKMKYHRPVARGGGLQRVSIGECHPVPEYKLYKKLSYRREAARCLVLLSILFSR